MQNVQSKLYLEKFHYLECNKGGFHFGKILRRQKPTLQCLPRVGTQNPQVPNNKRSKPLKMLLYDAEMNSKKFKPLTINLEIIKEIIQKSENELLILIERIRQDFTNFIFEWERMLKSFYISMFEEVKLKTQKNDNSFNQLFNSIKTWQNSEEACKIIKKIFKILPQGQQQECILDQKQIIDIIRSFTQQIEQSVAQKCQEIRKMQKNIFQQIDKNFINKRIWYTQTCYKFESKIKHHDITLISPFIVKSIYKFALMEPSLQAKPVINKKFAFKIKQVNLSNNWIAVGMCHKKIVCSKNFNFSFSSLGHGGYLISSNGGSWSNISGENNNFVKSFKYTKGQIIICEYEPKNKKIKFTKNSNKQKYELKFEFIAGDELHPCCLFYYINDQIQFLSNFKQQTKQ